MSEMGTFFSDSVSIFGGLPLPWTADQANKIGSALVEKASTKPAVASKKLSDEEMARLKATLFKPKITQKSAPAAPEKPAEEAKKKKGGIFGLF
jgi:hypothetical protein